jgi:hypothetical protein
VNLVLREAPPAARSNTIARAASFEERISGRRGLRSSVPSSQLFTASPSFQISLTAVGLMSDSVGIIHRGP